MQGILKDEKRILIGRDARFIDRVQRLFPANYLRIVARSWGPRAPHGRH